MKEYNPIKWIGFTIMCALIYAYLCIWPIHLEVRQIYVQQSQLRHQQLDLESKVTKHIDEEVKANKQKMKEAVFLQKIISRIKEEKLKIRSINQVNAEDVSLPVLGYRFELGAAYQSAMTLVGKILDEKAVLIRRMKYRAQHDIELELVVLPGLKFNNQSILQWVPKKIKWLC